MIKLIPLKAERKNKRFEETTMVSSIGV